MDSNKRMLHQSLCGLDNFATRLRRSTKLPQMQALNSKENNEQSNNF
jgi:hypothetical protein